MSERLITSIVEVHDLLQRREDVFVDQSETLYNSTPIIHQLLIGQADKVSTLETERSDTPKGLLSWLDGRSLAKGGSVALK